MPSRRRRRTDLSRLGASGEPGVPSKFSKVAPEPPGRRQPGCGNADVDTMSGPDDGPHTPAGSAVARGRVVAGVLWALLPLLTIGLLAGPVFGYAAVRLRSWILGVCGFGYLAASVTGIALAATSYNLTTFPSAAGAVTWFAIVPVVSCTHALLIRRRVFSPPTPYTAVDRARERLRRRKNARDLLRGDPELARELGVGRPDLRLDSDFSSYDDGGLLDVNHVPAEFIATVLGFDRETADRITGAREFVGRFASAEELALQADLPYDLIDRVKDRLLFL